MRIGRSIAASVAVMLRTIRIAIVIAVLFLIIFFSPSCFVHILCTLVLYDLTAI